MKLWVGVLRGLAVASVVLGGAALGSTVLSVATAGIAAAQPAPSIIVEGNRRVEADTIRSYFNLGPGEHLDAAKIDNGLKALYATGLFQDVRIRQSGGRLVVTVVEAPVINRVAFEGNKRVKDDQLTPEVQSKPRGTLSRAMVQADVQRIVEVYRHSGRYDVRVDPKIIDLPDNRVDLVFEISEGERTTVRRINFVGNNAFSDSRLKDAIKTSETGILSFFKNTNIYDADRIEADRELLRRFYLIHGYADVRVLAAQAVFDPELQGFIITFTIDEGEVYHFGAVDVQSNIRDVDPQTLRAKLRTHPGNVYNAEAVEKTVEEMTIELSKRGYPFAQVHPRGDRDTAGRLINAIYVVDEGSRAYIERINIRGNTRTRDYVIRREFDIAEGDAYNKVLIDRAERRLKNLQYFKTVKITNEPGSAPDRVVINVDVEEQATGEFSVSGGYSTTQGFLAEVSVGERNLLGRGQYAKASVTWGQYTKGATLSYIEPYLLGYRMSGGVDLFFNETIAYTFQSFGSQTFGTAFRVGIPLREDLSLQLRYSIYNQDITLASSLNTNCGQAGVICASAATQAAALQGPVWVSLVGYSLTYNALDNNKSPTSGLFAELKQDVAGLGGDVDFLKTTGDTRYYYNVYADIVALAHLQGGFATAFGGQQLRLLDGFFGGPWLVRGFAPNGFGPRDITPNTTQDNVGGTLYWGASLELQSPIPNLPKDVGLRVATFVDVGNVTDYKGPITFPQVGNQSITLAESNVPRSSAGVGLIWDSPFGPLRIDYAVALTKQNFDVLQQFMFGGGTKF